MALSTASPNDNYLVLQMSPVLEMSADSTGDHDVQCLDNPLTVAGDPLLSGFVLDLAKIW